jgi:hypothetical protein
MEAAAKARQEPFFEGDEVSTGSGSDRVKIRAITIAAIR